MSTYLVSSKFTSEWMIVEAEAERDAVALFFSEVEEEDRAKVSSQVNDKDEPYPEDFGAEFHYNRNIVSDLLEDPSNINAEIVKDFT